MEQSASQLLSNGIHPFGRRRSISLGWFIQDLRHSATKSIQARTGLDAEAAVFANSYDLVILDLGLPDVDG